MSEHSSAIDLSALLLPVTGQLLVVPSATVAEIIKMRELERPGNAPNWLLGRIQWHDEELPVVSFEALNDAGLPDPGSGSRIVILSTIGEHAAGRRFYAILTQGVPHLLRITPDDVRLVEDARPGPAERMKVSVYGQAAAIPDLDYLERHAMIRPVES